MTQEELTHIQSLQKLQGDLGEDFVLRYERQRLHTHPLVGDIRIIGRKDVAMGYDILSFDGPGSRRLDRYIEVKTYSGQPHFFLSQGEETAASKYTDSYYIYLVDLSRVSAPDYVPLIIQDPIHTLHGNSSDSGSWREKVQSREFVFECNECLPYDIDESTVIIGCFNSNEHLAWILHNHSYNVRQGAINGSVLTDDVSSEVRYLILYDSKSPRTYAMYSVCGVSSASRQQMLAARYPNPHAHLYLIYRLSKKIPSPPIDIMQIIRTYNDKLQRTSGTPIFIGGKSLRRYLLGGPHQQGTTVVRTFAMSGKPWSETETMKLSVMYRMGKEISQLSHEFKRTSAEIRDKLSSLHLL